MTSKLLDIKGFNKSFEIIEETEHYVNIRLHFCYIQLNADKTMFNASKLMNTIAPKYNKSGKQMDQWNTTNATKKWYQFKTVLYPNEWKQLKSISGRGKGNSYGGRYLPINLLYAFLMNFDSTFTLGLLEGIDIREEPGYVYLMHAPDMDNDVWKLGQTWSPIQRLGMYQNEHKGAKFYMVYKVSNQSKAERMFKEEVEKAHAVQVKGEYYRYGNSGELMWAIDNLLARLYEENMLLDDYDNDFFDTNAIDEIFNSD